MVDRTSMYLRLSIPCSKNAKIVANEIKRLLCPFKNKVHTITIDNGLEFAQHKSVSKALKCDFYFCDPYSSWQRGLNENINGLICQYIPKGSSFENITKKQIKSNILKRDLIIDQENLLAGEHLMKFFMKK